MSVLSESTLERTTLDWFESLGWQTVCTHAGVPEAEKFVEPASALHSAREAGV